MTGKERSEAMELERQLLIEENKKLTGKKKNSLIELQLESQQAQTLYLKLEHARKQKRGTK